MNLGSGAPMDLSQLKTTVMTMFMMKSNQPKRPGESSNSDIFMIIYSMIMMNLLEQAFRALPVVSAFVMAWAARKWGKPTVPQWVPLANKTDKEKEIINSITMTRIFTNTKDNRGQDKADNIYVEKVDAILDYICNLDEARHIRMDTRYSLNNTEEIVLTPLLKAKVNSQNNGEEGGTTEVAVFSTVLKISEIRNWIDEIHAAYVSEKNNKLGNKIYYFNEVPVEPIVAADMSEKGNPKKTFRWDNMPKQLTFNMNEFKTSKSFSNVYGHHVDELKERLDLFIKHPEWYMERGIPHSLGIMMHGVPGAGKTSTIKAIAKDTHRHIFNLSLRPHTTQRQLTNLFFNETVVVQTYDGGKQTLKIPMNKRVYVIEDIDCLTDVVLDRRITGAMTSSSEANKEGEGVTLSFLLNLLDGVLETPGRILIITSNYPEKLDKALVRPGRIDVKIEFKNATRDFILDMINKFYNLDMTLDEIPEELEDIFTPAEVMESMCMHFKNPSAALVHMVNKIAAKKAAEASAAIGTSLEDLGFGFIQQAQTPPRPATPPPSMITSGNASTEAPGTPQSEETNDSSSSTVGSKETPPRLTINPSPPENSVIGAGKLIGKNTVGVAEPSKEPKSYTYNIGGKSWVCTGACANFGPNPNCKDCAPKIAGILSPLDVSKAAVPGSTAGFQGFGSLLGGGGDNWGSALFEDAVPLPGAGGWMPHEINGKVISAVDLNQMAGRGL